MAARDQRPSGSRVFQSPRAEQEIKFGLNIRSISYRMVCDDDVGETLRLLVACIEDGYFYLDLHNNEDDEQIIGCLQKLLSYNEKLFKLPMNKMREWDK